MSLIFLGAVGIICLMAIGNWRTAIYASILMEALRDPVRKMSATVSTVTNVEQTAATNSFQSSMTTVAVAAIWLAALLGALTSNGRELRMMFRRYPDFRSSVMTLVASIIPGMLVSLFNYENGWILAAIGGVSYTAPMIGILLGYLWPINGLEIYRWMKIYVSVNALMLIGAIFEFADFEMPGLGGMNMVWIRYYNSDIIKLICGFYRSPDVMGLHAAHVIMFAALLAQRPKQQASWLWWSLCVWACIPLILCGRRKMIVIPLIFAMSFLVLEAIRAGRFKVFATILFLLAVGGVTASVLKDEFIPDNDYTEFASSIASEGVERASRSFTETVETTLQQAGWLGDGLGVVTQGHQYIKVETGVKAWQEDGVGRLFKELGIPGVILVLISARFLLLSLRSALKFIPLGHPANQLQFGFCGILGANLASFSVSHQAYSGDPSTVLSVGFFLGIILGLPRTVNDRPSNIGPSDLMTRTESLESVEPSVVARD